MEDRHQDHLLPDILERQAVLQAGNLPETVPDMQAAEAAGMQEQAAGMTAVLERPAADIRPVRQDCQISCQGAGECRR